MQLKPLRKRCEARLQDFPIPTPFDIRMLTEMIAARRGRPIELCVERIPIPTLSGLCVALETLDVIFYAAQDAPLHQEHIILHELCHLFCGHEGVAGEELLGLLFPDLRLPLPSLRREKYASEDEREAEMLASLILERVHRTQAHTVTPDFQTTTILQLLDSLEGMTFG